MQQEGKRSISFFLLSQLSKACPGPLWFQQSFGTKENTEFLGAIIEAWKLGASVLAAVWEQFSQKWDMFPADS